MPDLYGIQSYTQPSYNFTLTSYTMEHKINLIPSTNIYLETLHRCTQSFHRHMPHAELSSPCASIASCHSPNLLLLKKGNDPVCVLWRDSQSWMVSPLPGNSGGNLVAARCSFISGGSGPKNLTSLGKYPQL